MPPILAQQAFLRATATSFFFFASLNCFVLLPLYVTRLGGTEVAVGVVMGIYSGIGILCQPLVGPWVDALGRRPFMLLGSALVVLSSLLVPVFQRHYDPAGDTLLVTTLARAGIWDPTTPGTRSWTRTKAPPGGGSLELEVFELL